MSGGYWPNVELVANKCAGLAEDDAQGRDVSQYLAGMSPAKKSPPKGFERSFDQRDETPIKPFQAQEPAQPLRTQTPAKAEPAKQPEPTPAAEPVEENNRVLREEPSQKFIAPAAESTVPDTVCGRQLKSVEDLKSFPAFPEGQQGSLLCKYLTRDVWNKYHAKADAHGVSFKTCVLSGCQNTDSGIGCYAGSQDSYSAFSELFHPIITDYHKVKISDGHVSNMDYTQLVCPPFPEEDAKMIRSTRIRVGRNLAEFPLGPGLTREQRLDIEKKVTSALSAFEGDLKGKYYALSGMDAATQKQLIEDHFLFKEGDRFLEACGLNRNWPEGRGIYHNEAKTFLVWVNEEDQLRIISMQPGADIGAVFSRLSRAAAEIEKIAKFAHSKELGYITSCPTNLGTALRASVHIHLPYLGLEKGLFQRIADKYNVQIRGAHGEHTETNDHIYDISNKRRLGLSEVELVQDMYNGVKAMIEAEKEMRPAPRAPPKQPDQPAPQTKQEAPAAEKKQEEAPAAEQKQEEAPVAEKKEEPCKCGPHLKKPEDITGFPQFPEGTKSLLCKHLTPEVWAQLKDKKDECGVSFRQCILSGCQNVDSGIGCYAGSHKGYTDFAALFDPVIETYHGHKKADKHVSNMDYTKLNAPPLPEDQAKMIRSTRIRVGRNLAEFPLGPGITREQRN